MTLTAFFALRQSVVAASYYQKCVTFNIDPSLAGVPLPTQAVSGDATTRGEERSGRQLMTGESRDVRTDRIQVHRSNRSFSRVMRYSIMGLDDHELTPEQLKKRYKNRAYHRRKLAKRQAKAQLVMWPVQES